MILYDIILGSLFLTIFFFIVLPILIIIEIFLKIKDKNTYHFQEEKNTSLVSSYINNKERDNYNQDKTINHNKVINQETTNKEISNNTGTLSNSILIEVAYSIWAIKKYFTKLINENDLSKKSRQLNSQINRLENTLKTLNIEIEDYTGRKYNESMNVTPVDFERIDIETPIIKETIEPTILINNEIHKKARVIVGVPNTDDAN